MATGTIDNTTRTADRARHDRFLDGVEHDLRNPLNTLGMTIALLGRGKPTPELVARGERAIERAALMGDQLVALGRICFGSGIALKRQAARLDELVRAALPAPSDDRITFSPDGGSAGSWDVELLGRALSELVHNAIDHGGAGPIVLRTGLEPGSAFITVESAAPIAAGVADLVFDPFERAARARTGPPRGLGLGLYLARAIARAHGGDLVLSSSDGPTHFRLTVPCSSDEKKASS